MTDVIFARPRYDYPSYGDLWNLIRLSDYPLVYLDEIDPDSDRCYIFSTPTTEWERGWDNPRARIIYWALEWYLDKDYLNVPGVELWSADAWYAERIGARYVPLGSHPELRLTPDEAEPVYDTILLAGDSGNRHLARRLLHDARVTTAPDGWGEARDLALRQSKTLTNVHQWAHVQVAAPQRFALAAAYRKPLFTETLRKPGIFTHTYVFQFAMSYMADFLAMWTHRRENQQRLKDMGEALYDLLCARNTFRSVIEREL